MKRVAVVGAGRIGSTIARMLAATGDYAVSVADREPGALAALAGAPRIETRALDLADRAALDALLARSEAVVSAAPFHATETVAESAGRVGIHYLDLTEDVATTKRVKRLAAGARTAFVPQCGLAPGFISIVAADLARRFDELDAVRLRVGALPRYPTNALGYNLTWSTEGVINEYVEPCEAIVDGRLRTVPALEDREEFSLDGVRYEAFNTSGGLGTLCETLAGRVRTLNYRSIRYPGHRDIMKALLDDLRLRERREVLRDILEHALPTTDQDIVVVFATVSGHRGGRFTQESFARTIHAAPAAEGMRTAIQIATASAACAVLDLLFGGALPDRGFVRQEDVPLDAFLGNRFGAAYAQARALAA